MLRQDDQHHANCCAAADSLVAPFTTTWPAITESAWLLRRVPNGIERLVGLLESGLVECYDLDAGFVPWLKSFLHQYADLAPQVADASLVYTADCLDTDSVFTLDRRDFLVFRTKHGKPFRLIPEAL